MTRPPVRATIYTDPCPFQLYGLVSYDGSSKGGAAPLLGSTRVQQDHLPGRTNMATLAWSTHWPTSFWATTVSTIRRGLTGSLPESCRASPEVCEPSDYCPAGHFRTYTGDECQHHGLRSGRSLPDFGAQLRARRPLTVGLAAPATRDWPQPHGTGLPTWGGRPRGTCLHQARKNTTQDDKKSHSGFAKTGFRTS